MKYRKGWAHYGDLKKCDICGGKSYSHKVTEDGKLVCMTCFAKDLDKKYMEE